MTTISTDVFYDKSQKFYSGICTAFRWLPQKFKHFFERKKFNLLVLSVFVLEFFLASVNLVYSLLQDRSGISGNFPTFIWKNRKESLGLASLLKSYNPFFLQNAACQPTDLFFSLSGGGSHTKMVQLNTSSCKDLLAAL